MLQSELIFINNEYTFLVQLFENNFNKYIKNEHILYKINNHIVCLNCSIHLSSN